MVARKKSPESTSRRSVAQATDSTRKGWIEKKSAANPAAVLRPRSEAEEAAIAAKESKRKAENKRARRWRHQHEIRQMIAKRPSPNKVVKGNVIQLSGW